MTKGDKIDFAMAYIACALWASSDGVHESFEGKELPVATAVALGNQCADFLEKHAKLLEMAVDCVNYDWEKAGYDLWLTRNGHGAGYWDRDQLREDISEALARAAEAAGPVDIYLSDKGEVCV